MSTTDPTTMRESQTLREAAAQAVAAEELAQTAMATADGKGTRYDITTGSTRPEGSENDTLFEWSPAPKETGAVVTFVGSWDSSAGEWVAQELSHRAIASIDLGKATVGTLNVNNSVSIEATTAGGGHVILNGEGLEGLDANNNRKTFIGSDGTLQAEDASIQGAFRAGDPDNLNIVMSQETDYLGLFFRDGPSVVSDVAYFVYDGDLRRVFLQSRGTGGMALTAIDGPLDLSSLDPAGVYISGSRVTIRDKDLFPQGNDYDTGWNSTGVSIAMQSGWTLASYQLRRIGMRVRGLIIASRSSAITTGSDGNFTDIPAFTLPAAWRASGGPTYADVQVQRLGTAQLHALLNRNTGAVTLTHGSFPSQTVAAGTNLYFFLDYEV